MGAAWSGSARGAVVYTSLTGAAQRQARSQSCVPEEETASLLHNSVGPACASWFPLSAAVALPLLRGKNVLITWTRAGRCRPIDSRVNGADRLREKKKNTKNLRWHFSETPLARQITISSFLFSCSSGPAASHSVSLALLIVTFVFKINISYSLCSPAEISRTLTQWRSLRRRHGMCFFFSLISSAYLTIHDHDVRLFTSTACVT